jgi:hypothetical protein
MSDPRAEIYMLPRRLFVVLDALIPVFLGIVDMIPGAVL